MTSFLYFWRYFLPTQNISCIIECIFFSFILIIFITYPSQCIAKCCKTFLSSTWAQLEKNIVFHGHVIASNNNVWAVTYKQRTFIVWTTVLVFHQSIRPASSELQAASGEQQKVLSIFFGMAIPIYLFVSSERNNATVNNFEIITWWMSSNIKKMKPEMKSCPNIEECSCNTYLL